MPEENTKYMTRFEREMLTETRNLIEMVTKLVMIQDKILGQLEQSTRQTQAISEFQRGNSQTLMLILEMVQANHREITDAKRDSKVLRAKPDGEAV